MTAKEFETLARSLRPGLVRTARNVLHDEDAAEDIAQDTLLKLWTLRDALDRYRSIEGLAMVMSYRLAVNAIRNDKERAELTDNIRAEAPSGEDVLIAQENCEYIDSILATLPESQQTLIRLRHIEGYEISAIATMLGSSEGSIRTALSRARRRVALAFGIDSKTYSPK